MPGLNALAMIPIFGQGVTAGKFALAAGVLVKVKHLPAPNNIQLAQKGVRRIFTTVEEGSTFKYAGKSIREVAEGLRANRISPDEIPIDFVVIKGQKYAVNNRFLTALRRAGFQPTVTRDVTRDKNVLRSVQNRLREIEKGGFPSDATRIRGSDGVFSTLE